MKQNKFISSVAKDVIDIKFNKGRLKGATNTIRNEFYRIARKHGIKFGHHEKGSPKCSYQGATPEWVMTQQLFLDCFKSQFQFMDFFGIPKDLRY